MISHTLDRAKQCIIILLKISILLMEHSRVEGSRGSDAAIVEHPECRLFLAESTIPHAGLGIFTGIDLREGDTIAEPDIVVPFHDLYWHAKDDIDYEILWHQYSWNPKEVNMDYDMNADVSSAIVIGTGCMPNCNFALINAAEGKPDYDHAGLHRGKDPGTGGFTGYYNRMIAMRSIPAGGEIFANYGEQWFLDREEDVGAVPFERNFHEVDIFLTTFKRMSLMYQKADNPDFTRDLWDAVMSQAIYDTRSENALPLTFEDVQLAHGIGAAESRRPYSIRSPEWLRDHGRCMDNIRPGISTISQAGRGAFASRFIPAGGLVAPGPVLHMANRTSLNIYDETEDGSRDKSKHVSMQLILNYCFGHKQSTVLLCPYTSPSAYINHNSEMANVKVVWATNTTPNHNPDWLEEDVNFLKQTEKVGLSLDFIATRNIEPGEEVFLDYGSEWQAAWDKYIQEWTPLPDSDKFVTASMIQEPLRTVEEQITSHPYPNNIIFYCHYDDDSDMEKGRYLWEEQWIETITRPCKVLSRRAAAAAVAAAEEEVVEEKLPISENGSTTTTTSSKTERMRYYYTMAMLTKDEIDDGYVPPKFHIPNDEKDQHVLVDVPRHAIKVQDRLYSKDEFLTGKHAFRHEMMLSDEVFPKSWMNLQQ